MGTRRWCRGALAIAGLTVVACFVAPASNAVVDPDPSLPAEPGTFVPEGSVWYPTTTTDQRAELAVTLPTLLMRTDQETCGTLPGGGGNCSSAAIALAKPPANLPTITAAGNLFVRSPAGAAQKYGIFPSVRVRTVAFGSIPVEATVKLRQPLDAKGHVEPVKFGFFYGQGGVQPGTVVQGYEQIGPAPAPTLPANPFSQNPASTNMQFVGPLQASGTVDVSVSGVNVDGVPMSVGSGCKARGAKLTLTSTAGWVQPDYYNGSSDPKANEGLLHTKGTPYEFDPWGPPSYAHGNIDIPAFSGCRSGNDDLSRLITAMVSGRANPIEADMTYGLGHPWCDSYPACS